LNESAVPPRRREGTWAKIIRAEEHLAAIKAEIALFREADPYKLIGEFNAEGTEYVARLSLRELPPIRLQLLIGDFAHNLRSALDHLAGWLVVRNRGVPTKDTTFPIFLKPPKGPLQITPPIGVEAMALIESLQPYNTPDHAQRHKLALLREINNTDKHRSLFLATSVISHAQVWLEWTNGFPLTFPVTVEGRFKDGAELARIPVAIPVPAAQRDNVKVQATASALVTFAEPEPIGDHTVDRLLGHLLEYVTAAVTNIEAAEHGRTL
jgi:hypothetical protein